MIFAKSVQSHFLCVVDLLRLQHNYENLEKTSDYIPQEVPIQLIKQLNLSQSYAILTDPENQRRLFPDGVTVTFSADGSTCENLAFHSLLPVRDGATRVGVWIYGKDLSARLAAAHVMYWLQTPLNATKSK